MQPCKRRVRPPPGSPPAQGRSPPEQAQSEKSQGVRGTESPDSPVNTKETENYVSVFSGELQQSGLANSLTEPVSAREAPTHRAVAEPHLQSLEKTLGFLEATKREGLTEKAKRKRK
jgi:hypothetical protein